MFIQKFGGKSPSFGKDLFQEGLGPPPRVDIEKEYTNPEFKFPYIPRNKIYLERDLQAYSEAKNCLLSSSVPKLYKLCRVETGSTPQSGPRSLT